MKLYNNGKNQTAAHKVLADFVFRFTQARREPQRGPGNHSRGALSQFLYVLRARRRQGGNVGGVSPHHPTRGLGERRISSSSGAENGFYAYLRSEGSHLEHLFQYF